MKFICSLLVVENLEKSKMFYEKILGLKVEQDFGANVQLSGGVSLQTKKSWLNFIGKNDTDIFQKSNDSELYFEEDDFDSFIIKLEEHTNIEYVHKPVEHRWGQRVVRFYDLDKHIIEVGENIKSVVRRFLDSGMNVGEVAKRMEVSQDYVKFCMK